MPYIKTNEVHFIHPYGFPARILTWLVGKNMQTISSRKHLNESDNP